MAASETSPKHDPEHSKISESFCRRHFRVICYISSLAIVIGGFVAVLAWIIHSDPKPINVQITTRPPLNDDKYNEMLLCTNSTITLVCDANSTFGNIKYQWLSPLEYDTFEEGLNSVKVEVKAHPVSYQCNVSDEVKKGSGSITIVSNGGAPLLTPINFDFNNFVKVGQGTEYNLTAEVYSKIPLISDPVWVLFYNQPLPGKSHYSTFAKHGKAYTSVLTLSDLSLSDSGYYMMTATNDCGTSSILVYVNVVRVTNRCLPENTTIPPLISGCKDQATVDGATLVYKCSFKGNFNRLHSSFKAYWTIDPPGQRFITVNNDAVTNYAMKTYHDCPNLDSQGLCCEFSTELHINASRFIDGANVSCAANIGNLSNYQSVVYSSANLVVLPKPLLMVPMDDIVEVKTGQAVKLECQFKTVTAEQFTKFKWSKGTQPITDDSSERYHFSEMIIPGTEHRMISKLMITNVTNSDKGMYTCSCEYNTDIMRQLGVTRSIISDSSTVILELVDASFNRLNLYLLICTSLVTVLALLYQCTGRKRSLSDIDLCLEKFDTKVIKAVYKNHVTVLIQALPMEDSIFISNLHKEGLLSDTLKQRVVAESVKTSKASLFLDAEIERSLNVDVVTPFEKLLRIMKVHGNSSLITVVGRIHNSLSDEQETFSTSEQ